MVQIKPSVGRTAAVLFCVLAVLALAYLFFGHLFSPLLPFIISYAIAFSLQDVTNYFEKRFRVPRKLSAAVLVILVSGIFFLICALIVKRAYEELTVLAQSVKSFIDSLRDDPRLAGEWIERINDAVPFFDVREQLTDIWLNIDSRLQQLLGVLAEKLSGAVLPFLGGVITVLPNAFLAIFVIITASYYMTVDFGRINSFLLSLFPQKIRSHMKNAYFDAKRTVFRFLKAYGIILLITFAQLFAGFLLLDVKYAFLVAVLTALVDILPVLGTGTVLVPWSIWLFATGNYTKAAGLLVLYVVISVIRQVIEPKIVGKYIGLYPLATLFSMYLGLKLAGLAGLLLFPLAAMVIKGVAERKGAQGEAFSSNEKDTDAVSHSNGPPEGSG